MEMRGIQLRLALKEKEQLTEFKHKGVTFKIVGVSPNRDLIPNNATAWIENGQLLAIGSNGKRCEVYVYIYTKFEGGRYAVVDTIREVE